MVKMGHSFLFAFLVLSDKHRKQLCTLSNNPDEKRGCSVNLFLAYLAYVAAGNTAVCHLISHILCVRRVSVCAHVCMH